MLCDTRERTAAQIRMRMDSDEDFRKKVMPLNPNLEIPQYKEQGQELTEVSTSSFSEN